MNGPTAISVKNLGKMYRIGHQAARRRHTTLRDAIVDRFRLGRRTPGPEAGQIPTTEDFWALKNVSFEVNRGDVLGIIGRNGAGKSTLLKVLSRITEPSRGQVRIKGRIASLLEVGTGFHPELTGRENIRLNGAILGMSQREIRKKFDEIVDFAGIEKFLDTPVKHYSSGMYVRLAFAVAAHLEPEILVVDEVLAVGDAQFQEKCLGKMREVASKEGRTVLFVSHNMSVIQQLCNRCILLQQGEIVQSGDPAEVVSHYYSDSSLESSVDLRGSENHMGSGELRLERLTVTNAAGTPTSTFPVGGTACFQLEAIVHQPIDDPAFGVVVHGASGEPLIDLRTTHSGLRIGRAQGRVVIHGTYPNIFLYPGKYRLTPWITDAAIQRSIDYVHMPCTIQVIPAPGKYGDLGLDPAWGKFWAPSDWKALFANEPKSTTPSF